MTQVTEAQIEEFKEIFQLFDTDGDGVILAKELGPVLRSIGENPTDVELKALIDELEYPTIDFSKFISILARRVKDVNPEEELRQAFNEYDKDGDGLISTGEIRREMERLALQLGEPVDPVDNNDDRLINFQEFLQLLSYQN